MANTGSSQHMRMCHAMATGHLPHGALFPCGLHRAAYVPNPD